MKRSILAPACAVAIALSLTGCGLGTAGGYAPEGKVAGELASIEPLDGAQISVGSKNFTEQLILGKMAVILLHSAGADVQDFTNIPGSSAARQAQLEGRVTMEWEYTGTAWISYLGRTRPIADSRKQFEAVRDDDAKNGLTWLDPAPMNNTYSFASRADTAQRLRTKDLSDLKKVPKAERTLCVENEFANREDGLVPMLKAYGLELGTDIPSSQIKKLDTGAIYAAIDNKLCNFGEVFTTDGRIKSLELAVLTDSLHFFPNYNVSPVVSTETMKKYPQIAKLFEPVTKKLTNDVLIDLNAKVDVDGQEPAVVAQEWLEKEGFIE